MEYYDDDYEKTYDGYEEHIEPVNLVAEICTESDITDALLTAGLISGGADPGLTHRVAKEVRRVLAEAEVEDT